MRFVALSIICVSLSGHALPVAEVQLPDGFAANSERLDATGFGGYNRGSFRLGELKGKFSRGESRLGLLNDSYVSNKGSSSFLLQDAESTEIASADCKVGRKTVNVDVVTFDPKKMSYQCDFWLDDKLLGARLLIGQPKAKGLAAKMLAMDRRSGQSSVFDNHLGIESLHKYAGSKLQSSAPIGYQLTFEETIVAVVQLTDVNPTLFVAGDIGSDLRLSVIATALALMVLRDPANSALED